MVWRDSLAFQAAREHTVRTLSWKRPEQVPTAEAFRQTGYTAAAVNFPMSDAAVTELCRFNGITLEHAPPTWYFAPNETIRRFWEDTARVHQKDSPNYSAD